MTLFSTALWAGSVGWKVVLAGALVGTLSSTVYLLIVLKAAWRFKREAQAAQAAAQRTPDASLPTVSILKPVHGMEPRLAENLASFFEQDYPRFEVIFGARDEDNAALRVANEVRALYPHVPSRVVLSGVPTWPNAKVFSLQK